MDKEKQMKTIVFTRYGSPDVLQLEDVAKPIPKPNEVLIKIHAASANPLDWHRMRGAPILARLDGGLSKPKDTKMGADVAGVVEAVGSEVTQFRPGDEVFGDIFTGAFAEYVCAPEKTLALKPANSTFEEAAAVPVAALTALQGLRDKGQLQPGQKVLVNGASGGVGTFTVQIAKALGAEVTGVCSTRNLEMVRKIGADQVIDYTREDFTKTGQQYDLIYDAVGNYDVPAYTRALKPNGVCAIAGFTTMGRLFGNIILGAISAKTVGKKIEIFSAKASQKDLMFIKDLIEAGKVKPVIDKRYPLVETADAIRYLETARARGKVVIHVDDNAA